MKRVLFVFLIFTAFTTFGQTKSVSIRHYNFIFKTFFTYNENGDSIQKVTLYKDAVKLITHIISKSEGDCNSESIELGAFEVHDTSMIFYSYWTRAGDAPVSPFGIRKQIYSVNKNGKLILTSSTLYIETSEEGWKENKGIKYLFSKPKKEFEKKQLQEYITDVEKTYKGKFVFGVTKNSLLTEVRTKLKNQIEAKTKDWKTHYTCKLGGYKL